MVVSVSPTPRMRLADDLNEEQLRTFVFENPVRFYGSMNPDFFTGTALEKEAAAELTG